MKQVFKLSTIAVCVALAIAQDASAAYIRTDIDYQTYRDFAENKGQFAVGVQNITINDIQGNKLGTILKGVPMPDFSSADRNNAVATAVDTQYLAGVAHNGGYGYVSFGGQGNNPDAHHFNYLIVNRNDEDPGWGGNTDYHLPRIHKLITEIVPVPMTSAGDIVATYENTDRFPLLLRVGSGTQKTRAIDGTLEDITGAYKSLLAGVPFEPTSKYSKSDFMWVEGNLYNNKYAPLTTYGVPGDSGSPLYGYDTQEKRWVLVGVLSTYSGNNGKNNGFIINRPEYLEYLQEKDQHIDAYNTLAGDTFSWTAKSNTSTLSQKGVTMTVDLADPSLTDSAKARPSLDHGKNVKLSGANSTLVLKNNINQGAGALTLDANITVKADNDSTWQGAGVTVTKGKKVNWQVKNPEGDRLSKLGEGELWVNGSGENKGDISVGDGLVVLAQNAKNGKQQAFNSVGIVSGRPTVRLDKDKQVDPNNIYFGFRGGRLDMNGKSLTFNHIQNVDDGAKIANNHKSATSTVTITGRELYTEKDLQWGGWRESDKDIYEYKYRGHSYYLTLTGNPNAYFPTNGISNSHWEVLSTDDKQTAVNIVLARKNAQKFVSTYNGYLGENSSGVTNGKLNVVFKPTDANHMLVLSGGIGLNGNLATEGGALLLSGAPVQHAYDKINDRDIFFENDWLNRAYSATQIKASKEAKLYVGRNVTEVKAALNASDNAQLHLGFEQGKSLNCIYSSYSGNTNCQTQAVISAQNFANLPVTHIIGNATLSGNSSLALGKAHLQGNIQGNANTIVRMSRNAEWTNNADSKIGNLVMEQGSVINLNDKFASGVPSHFNNLIIQGDLDGNGQFNYLTNAANGKSDHVSVNGTTKGAFTLALKNSGKEPTKSSPLSLLTLNKEKSNDATVLLAGNYVDLGAYRYVLANQDSDYRLYSPLKDAKDQNVNVIDEAAAQAALQEAIRDAEHKHNDVEALAATVAEQEKVVQNAQTILSSAQSQLEIAQTALAKLKWINFIKRARLNKEIKALNNTISTAQADLKNANSALYSSKQALNYSQDLAKQADAKLEEVKQTAMEASKSKKIVYNLCVNSGVSESVCSLFASAESEEEDTQQRDWVSMYSNAALSELSAQTQGMLQIGRSIDNQLFHHSDKPSVWAATDYQRTEHESNLYRPYKQNGTLTQVGVETPIGNGFSLGAVFSHHYTNNDFDDALKGSGRMNVATVYGKYRSDFGTFFGIDTSYGKARNKMDTSKFHRSYTALGVNLGHDFEVSGINAQPSIGARYYRFGKANYDLLDATIETPKQHFMTYQAGVKVSKTFGEQWKVTPSMAVYYVDANHRKLNVSVNDHQFDQQFGRYLRGEAGVTIQNQRWQIGLNAGLLSGNEVKHQRFAGAKLSYNW